MALKKSIEREAYIHPMDQQMSERVYGSRLVRKTLDMIFEHDLDAVHTYVYAASSVKLPDYHPVVSYLGEGCRIFGLSRVPPVYLIRSYNYDVICTGYNEPFVLVPEELIRRNDMSILRGRMMAAAASIRAGHHKLGFLIWIIENLSGAITIPLIDTAVRGLLYEWMRCREYSVDRAFLLAVEDYKLTLKNILYGSMPFDMLEQFCFGDNDTYSPQVQEFYRKDSITEAATALYSLVQCEIWLPARYKELREFHERGGGPDGQYK